MFLPYLPIPSNPFELPYLPQLILELLVLDIVIIWQVSLIIVIIEIVDFFVRVLFFVFPDVLLQQHLSCVSEVFSLSLLLSLLCLLVRLKLLPLLF